MSDFPIRRIHRQIWEERVREDRTADVPLRKVIVAALIGNPYAGRWVEDLTEAQEFSVGLGKMLGGLAAETLGEPAQSYGKGAIGGLGGSQEHAVMFITTPFGNEVRAALGGGKAWIPSATIVAAAGASLLIPMAHKDALYVRDNYDAARLYAPDDAPRHDEVLVAVAVANRGRLNARLGGIKHGEVEGKDGLR